MHQLGNEEKAALLLTADDNDDEAPNDQFPVIAKHPRTYHRHRSAGIHPILCFALVLGAFILGSITGVVIILYRMSQDIEQKSPQISTQIDLSLRTKLFQSIISTNFLNLNHSIESDDDLTAGKLFDKWQTYSPSLSHVNKFSYEIQLSKYTSSDKRNGIDVLDSQNREVLKLDRLSNENFVFLSSLVKSTSINANSIYYVNYGREEDFAYLIDQRINLNNQQQSIVVMRYNSTIISRIEQIHQAIHYGFAGLIFFHDIDQQSTSITNDRRSFFREWARYPTEKDRSNFLSDLSHNNDHSISILILSYDDLQKLFSAFSSDSSSWPSAPSPWYNNRPTQMKIGGTLTNFKIRFVANFQETNVKLPVVMSSIRGDIDPERFVMVGVRLGARQQNEILTEIIRIYTNQIKNGWKPKRSILFCAWSGLDFDQYTVRRWFSENSFLIDKNLISYLDLGNGILSNSTLNLHGSSLLEQIVHNAANSTNSPLKHNHTCHNQQTTPTMNLNNDESHHDHGKRKRRDNNHEQICEEHKLLDEWFRASRNRFGMNNQTWNLIQNIDTDSTASFVQLQYGIPSLVIEMTDEKTLTNETFYTHDYLSSTFDEKISVEIYIAYTQFLTEIIRQLIDQPLIAFNLTIYANQIDRFTKEYLRQFDKSYQYLAYHLGNKDDFRKLSNELTQTIRNVQLRIDQISQNDFNQIHVINKQFIEFERLFLMKDSLFATNSPSKISKHILIGPAFGLTKTVVPYPFLSNILYGIPDDPPTELCDQSQVLTFKFKEQIRFINRTLNGFDGLFST